MQKAALILGEWNCGEEYCLIDYKVEIESVIPCDMPTNFAVVHAERGGALKVLLEVLEQKTPSRGDKWALSRIRILRSQCTPTN